MTCGMLVMCNFVMTVYVILPWHVLCVIIATYMKKNVKAVPQK